MRFSGGSMMAKTLVTYIDDPHKVRDIVKNEFPETRITISRIEELRNAFERDRNKIVRGPKLKKRESSKPRDERKEMAESNQKFLRAMWKEHPRIMKAHADAGRKVTWHI